MTDPEIWQMIDEIPDKEIWDGTYLAETKAPQQDPGKKTDQLGDPFKRTQ